MYQKRGVVAHGNNNNNATVMPSNYEHHHQSCHAHPDITELDSSSETHLDTDSTVSIATEEGN